MNPQLVTNFAEFTDVVNAVISSDKSKAIALGGTRPVVIVPVDEYNSTMLQKTLAKAALKTMTEELSSKNAHLDPEQIDDELFNITMKVRYDKKNSN